MTSVSVDHEGAVAAVFYRPFKLPGCRVGIAQRQMGNGYESFCRGPTEIGNPAVVWPAIRL